MIPQILAIFLTLIVPNFAQKPTIFNNTQTNLNGAAEALRTAMSGWLYADKTAINNVITKVSNAQRQELIKKYKSSYGKDLIAELRSWLINPLDLATSVQFGNTIIGLMYKPDVYDAKEMYDAMSGPGTTEYTLTEIAATRTNREIDAMKKAYKEKYGSELDADVKSETWSSRAYSEFLIALLQGQREESQFTSCLQNVQNGTEGLLTCLDAPVDFEQVKQDAQALYDAGEKIAGSDTSIWIKIFATRSYRHLRAVFDEYNKANGHSIEDAIKKEYASWQVVSGKNLFRDLLLAVTSVARDKAAYFANALYESMKGTGWLGLSSIGTWHDVLIRIIVSRSEQDLEDIKRRYQDLYKTSLEADIKSEITGYYQTAVVNIVKGNLERQVSKEDLKLENRLKCITYPDEKTGKNVCNLPDTEKLDFIFVGDAGGLDLAPYYTSAAQLKVADGMAEMSEKVGAKFVLNAGDNVYKAGVRDIYDGRFEHTFENVYATKKSLLVPWYMIAGNHDHLGNASAQVAYTFTETSQIWTFPNLYYKVAYKFGKKLVEFIMIDTIILCGNDIDLYYKTGRTVVDFWTNAISKEMWNLLWTSNKPVMKPGDEAKAKVQWAWIEKQLNESNADYLFVVGHYPVYSASDHGPTECLVNKLDPLLRKYKATAYFSGHDHNVQHIRVVKEDSGGSIMNYFVSGAGALRDKSKKHEKDLPAQSLKYQYPTGWGPLTWLQGQFGFADGAFIHVQLKQNNAVLTFYNSISAFGGNLDIFALSGIKVEKLYQTELSLRK